MAKNNISSDKIIADLMRLLPYKKEVLKVSDIATAWDMSPSVVRRLIEQGSLEAVPIPGSLKETTTYITTRNCVKSFLDRTWQENKMLNFAKSMVGFLEEQDGV